MAAGLLGAYRDFREQRRVCPSAHTIEPRRSAPKVAERPVPVWLRKEIQEMLRRSDGELNGSFGDAAENAPARSAIIEA